MCIRDRYNAHLLNVKCNLFYFSLYCKYSTVTNNDDCDIQIDNESNKKSNKTVKPDSKYIKIIIENPYNNRDIILKMTKKQKGVYV